MAIKTPQKGKKPIREETPDDSSLSSLSPPPVEHPVKRKPKRAETRPCPVCEELIPIRLLGKHLDLELQRVEDIVKAVGSTEVLQDDDREEGPSSSSRNRRSAVKARKSIGLLNPRSDPTDSVEATTKTIQAIKLHRKKRHGKLREMTRDEEDGRGPRATWANGNGEGEGTACPVCGQVVRGDKDVIEAHVDSCLAHEGSRIEAERIEAERAAMGIEEDIDIDGDGDMSMRLRATDGANLRGLGFHTRNDTDQDVDDVIDVDGDDEAVFGGVQFTEGDILGPTNDTHVQIDSDSDDEHNESGPHKTLRDLVAEGKVVRRTSPTEGVEAVKAKMEEVMGVGDADRMDIAVNSARRHGNQHALIKALEDKIKQLESMRVSSSTSLLCRICLDPYTEPTASTGCWHTCCRECWLRCLGSTKLCPICKRITAAADLRRVFL